jgi:hypothetical protein
MMRQTEIFQLENNATLRKIVSRYATTGLRFGWKSNNEKSYDLGHWNNMILRCSKHEIFDISDTPFIERHKEIQFVWNTLKDLIGQKSLMRCYINGYTFGTDGYAHVDDPWYTQKYGEDKDSETIVVYLNEKWHIDWAGETVIFNGYDIERAVLPKFGRTLVFDSRKTHAARPVSRACPALRTVLVFKTGDVRVRSEKVDYLLTLTKGIPHSNRTFFEHLFNTSMILENLEVSDDVRSAGLFHSIYSTEYFKHDLHVSRERIKELIGEYAENLVYEFCTLPNRFEALVSNSKGYSDEMVRDLLTIEGANLRDQNVGGKYDKQLIKLASLTNYKF